MIEPKPVEASKSNSNCDHKVSHEEHKYDDSKVELKLVFTGDMGVGKTALCHTFAEDEFPQESVPTMQDVYNKDLVVRGSARPLSLYD